MTKEGEFAEFEFEGVPYLGKALLDLADQITRRAYFTSKESEKEKYGDFVSVPMVRKNLSFVWQSQNDYF